MTAAEGLETGGNGVEIYGWVESLLLRDFLRAFMDMRRREGKEGGVVKIGRGRCWADERKSRPAASGG